MSSNHIVNVPEGSSQKTKQGKQIHNSQLLRWALVLVLGATTIIFIVLFGVEYQARHADDVTMMKAPSASSPATTLPPSTTRPPTVPTTPIPAPSTPSPTPSPTPTPYPTLTILQVNDVYELNPTGGYGGMSRPIAYKKMLQQQNPNTVCLIAGDLISPSAMSTARVNGTALNGVQMVDVGNMLFDVATFGNHEFDVNINVFAARVSESQFDWVFSNGNLPTLSPVPTRIVPYAIRTVQSLVVGIVSATTTSNVPAYVNIMDYPTTVTRLRTLIADLRATKNVNFVIALTHLDVDTDKKLLAEDIGIDMTIGGHEHENMYFRVTPKLLPLSKADSNAKTMWVHTLTKRPEGVTVDSRLVPVPESLPTDPAAEKVIEKWKGIAAAAFLAQGFDIDAVVVTLKTSWDLRSETVRTMQTDPTKMMADSMINCSVAGAADGAVYNGGSIRIDDVVRPGPITNYDVLRMLPFGNLVYSYSISGSLMKSMFETSRTKNYGGGGYVQMSSNFTAGCMESGQPSCKINGVDLDVNRMYTIVSTDYLFGGKEANLGFVVENNTTLTRQPVASQDMRMCFRNYMANMK